MVRRKHPRRGGRRIRGPVHLHAPATFGVTRQLPRGRSWNASWVGDLDGDGLIDACWAAPFDNARRRQLRDPRRLNMPATGDLIGPYRVISQLGKGAMGEVWRARDERLDRYVALKVLPADVAGDVERRARMLREARAAAAIRHPNVVTLYDIVAHDGDDILVMELVEGRTVSEALRKDGPPPLEIGAALDRGRRRRARRRARAPASCIATSRPRTSWSPPRRREGARLRAREDARRRRAALRPPRRRARPRASGRSRSTRRCRVGGSGDVDSYQTHAGQLLGTPLYMAPEQIDGAPPDERSEVFSVGVLAYEILTGKPPYTATSIDALFEQILHDRASRARRASPSRSRRSSMRALAKDPAAAVPVDGGASRCARRRARAPVRTAARRWPLVAAAALLLAGAGVGALVVALAPRAPARPGDDKYVARALEEYDVFYNDKALSSLRAALARRARSPARERVHDPVRRRADADRDAALAAARARATTEPHSKDRALLDAAIALRRARRRAPRARRCSAPVRRAIASSRSGPPSSTTARATTPPRSDEYKRAARRAGARVSRPDLRSLLVGAALPRSTRRGAAASASSTATRSPARPTRSGSTRRRSRPPASSTRRSPPPRRRCGSTRARTRSPGLAKVLALKGDRARARELYQRSLDRAGPSRRPLRRAALGFLQWIDGDAAAAKRHRRAVPHRRRRRDRPRARRLPVRRRRRRSRARSQPAAQQLDALAAEATDAAPGLRRTRPRSPKLVRARAQFFGGGCVVAPDRALHGRPSTRPRTPRRSTSTPRTTCRSSRPGRCASARRSTRAANDEGACRGPPRSDRDPRSESALAARGAAPVSAVAQGTPQTGRVRPERAAGLLAGLNWVCS